MARYPDRSSASIPALWAVQRRYGWCTPEGIRQAAAVMRVTPAYLESVASFYDLLHTEPVGTPPGRSSAPTSPAGCGAATSCSTPSAPPPRARGRLRHRLRVPRRLRHRADGLDRRALLRPARDGRRGDRGRAAARRRRGPAREGARRSAPPAGEPTARCRGRAETRVLLEHAEDPALRDDRRLPGATAATRPWSGPTARSRPTRCSTSSRTPACAAAAAPASRWARRPRSCRAAKWPSTSAATPTSPSPAPSRTAS